MTEKRTVFISGTPYTVTISSEQEVLSAAYAAGVAVAVAGDAGVAGTDPDKPGERDGKAGA